MNLHILGIRHHGIGSARYVQEALLALAPDLILVEGPPELDKITEWVGHKNLVPPVAVLGYNVAEPSQAVFYPFTHFSPEWQAIGYAQKKKIKVRMMDLPLSHSFGIQNEKKALTAQLYQEKLEKITLQENQDEKEPENGLLLQDDNPTNGDILFIQEENNTDYLDPIGHLAKIAGYDDSELWWEHNFEQTNLKGAWKEHFEAVFEAMKALREHIESPQRERDDLREAYMRKMILEAKKEGFGNVVVVCGAWHASMLSIYQESEKQDMLSLAQLPTTTVQCTWIPWTNARLSLYTGYGAGIVSPGWYGHLWKYGDDKGIRWLSKVARLFREKGMDTSSAHVIEAYRLSEALAAMRDISRPGLLELNEATQTVICFGDKILLKLVEDELIIAKAMGKTPSELPKLPIQIDFEKQAKKLNFKAEDIDRKYELDLRKKLDLQKSVWLHRLDILDIGWAKRLCATNKGTFKEVWSTRWKPEMEIQLIEKGFWGNTIEASATKILLEKAEASHKVGQVAQWIERAIPSELFYAIDQLLDKITEISAVSADMVDLMQAILPLIQVSRYGNVRKTDLNAISLLIDGMVRRVCIGLPNASYGLDESSSYHLFESIKKVNEGVELIQNEEILTIWYSTLKIILHKEGVNGIVLGCVCRMLYDSRQLDAEATAKEFGLALSAGNEPASSAVWLEGFLKGSGSVLLHDYTLWNILYGWVAVLEQTTFLELMPILRRTFSKFDTSERKEIGIKAKKGILQQEQSTNIETHRNILLFDEARALKSLEIIEKILFET